MSEAIAVLRQHGAIVVDPVDVPPAPPVCRDQAGARGKDTDCSIVFKYGMKRDFNRWLVSLGPGSPVKTLTELREWNLAHRAEGAIKYGQAQLDISDEVNLERDRVRYLADRAADVRLTGAEGIDADDQAPPSRCYRLRRIDGRGSSGQAGLSDCDCAVRFRAEHRIAAVSTRV